MARRTPLFDRHVALGARMVDFGGFDMPLQYTSIRDEHVAVRERAGLFDVCHMGEVHVSGRRALEAVQALVANDVSRLEPGGELYAVMCNERGGIVDDVIVIRGTGEHAFATDAYMVVINAARREVDVRWMRDHLAEGAVLEDVGDATSLLALQGPRALEVAQRVARADLGALRPFTAVFCALNGVDTPGALVSRTGYTGEDGVEIYGDARVAPLLWDALLEAGRDVGVVPAGLGARDTLRLEAGLRLYGQDMWEEVDPYSAGLGWTVKLQKGDFTGRAALVDIRAAGPPQRTVGLRLGGRAIARHGHDVLSDGRRVGTVTSGTFGFTVGGGIATALVEPAAAGAETFEVDIRGTASSATAVSLPFYRRAAAAAA